MVRAVLDANVVLGAALRPEGPPGRILDAYLHDKAFELVLTPDILAEMERAFRYPKIRRRVSQEEAQGMLLDLLLLADLVDDLPLAAVCRDPEDDKYLWAAVAGRATFLVTGDDDLLALREHEGVTILTPREFLVVLESSKS